MNITLERIRIRKFKGISALDIDFGPKTSIWGENATGKTTIFDAFLWTLFGKDSLNKADFEIKALDQKGEPAHNVEHSVEVVILVDGRPMALNRVFQEKYTKKRGVARQEFTGHTTDFFIDGVPMKEKEYQERVRGIMDENLFRLLTDPRYFNEVLHWTDRRKILMSVCGDVTADEVIGSDSSLAVLRDILNNYGIDDYKKMIASQKSKINDELKKIPTRIDEVKRGIVETATDLSAIPAQIKDLEAKKAALDAKLTDLKNGGAISAKRIELQDIEAEIRRMKNAYEEDKATLIGPLQNDLSSHQERARELGNQIRNIENDISRNSGEIKGIDAALEGLRAEWNKVEAQAINVTDKCPTCGQALPEIEVQGACEKANCQKADKLAEIQKQGREKAAKRDEFAAQVEKQTGLLQELRQEKAHIDEQEADCRKKIEGIKSQAPDLSGYEARKASVQAEIDNIMATERQSIDEVIQQIAPVRSEIDKLLIVQAKAKSNEAAHKRVSELEQEEKDLAAQYEAIEKSLFLCENFIRAKVGLLESRINEKFSLVRFRLFENQINGGLDEVCVTTLNGVPYPSINNAGRIQAGMDIIRTLQAHYGITAPVWIDNRESIIDLPEMPGQTISLIVSEGDKALRIETNSEPKMKKAGGM